MRYHRNEPGKPWPLVERLWEARRALWIGPFVCALLLACILFAVEFVAQVSSGGSARIGRASLAFVYQWWGLIAIVAIAATIQTIERELARVNEDSETFEELVIRRLQRIEEALNAETMPSADIESGRAGQM
jgi:hypothetical protein